MGTTYNQRKPSELRVSTTCNQRKPSELRLSTTYKQRKHSELRVSTTYNQRKHSELRMSITAQRRATYLAHMPGNPAAVVMHGAHAHHCSAAPRCRRRGRIECEAGL